MGINLFYRLLYVLLHCIFTIYEWIFSTVQGIETVFVDFCHEFGVFRRTNYLKIEIDKKNKIPKHLTVLLGQEEPSYKDLANIVIWCMVNNIAFLSFYDYQGNLKKNQYKLEKALSKKLSSNDRVIWHNNPGSMHKNGYIGRKIHVKLLSQENGKSNIVKHVQDLCKLPSSTDYSIASIDHALRQDFEFPDPDLGLSVGSYLYFFDYPPWQLRITEFLSIESHYRIKYRTFLEQLFVYGQCEQRLGK